MDVFRFQVGVRLQDLVRGLAGGKKAHGNASFTCCEESTTAASRLAMKLARLLSLRKLRRLESDGVR